MANARALCVVLLIEMATDFDSRVVQVATSLPMTLAWLPHGPPSRAVPQRQTVAIELLSLLGQNDELARQSTPWELAFLFKDQLRDVVATGCIDPTLHALLDRLVAAMSSDTQEIEGINGTVKFIKNIAPNISMKLLTSRVVNKKTLSLHAKPTATLLPICLEYHSLAKKASEDPARLKDLEPLEGEVETLAQADTLANGSSRPKMTKTLYGGRCDCNEECDCALKQWEEYEQSRSAASAQEVVAPVGPGAAQETPPDCASPRAAQETPPASASTRAAKGWARRHRCPAHLMKTVKEHPDSRALTPASSHLLVFTAMLGDGTVHEERGYLVSRKYQQNRVSVVTCQLHENGRCSIVRPLQFGLLIDVVARFHAHMLVDSGRNVIVSWRSLFWDLPSLQECSVVAEEPRIVCQFQTMCLCVNRTRDDEADESAGRAKRNREEAADKFAEVLAVSVFCTDDGFDEDECLATDDGYKADAEAQSSEDAQAGSLRTAQAHRLSMAGCVEQEAALRSHAAHADMAAEVDPTCAFNEMRNAAEALLNEDLSWEIGAPVEDVAPGRCEDEDIPPTLEETLQVLLEVWAPEVRTIALALAVAASPTCTRVRNRCMSLLKMTDEDGQCFTQWVFWDNVEKMSGRIVPVVDGKISFVPNTAVDSLVEFGDAIAKGRAEVIIPDTMGVTMVRAKGLNRNDMPEEMLRVKTFFSLLCNAKGDGGSDESSDELVESPCAACEQVRRGGTPSSQCPICHLHWHPNCQVRMLDILDQDDQPQGEATILLVWLSCVSDGHRATPRWSATLPR